MNTIIIIISLITLILLIISFVCTLTKPVENFEVKDSLSQTIKQINQEIERETYISGDKGNNIQGNNKNIESNNDGVIVKEETSKEPKDIYTTKKNSEVLSTSYQKTVYVQPDMTKFILKSELPKCPTPPNLSKYILKTQVPNQPNMNNYILKNTIPSCPNLPNMDNYILKNTIPSSPKPINLSKYVMKSSIPPPIECPCLPIDHKIPKGCPNAEKICPKGIDQRRYILKSKIPKCPSKNKKAKKFPKLAKVINKDSIINKIKNTINTTKNKIKKKKTSKNMTNTVNNIQKVINKYKNNNSHKDFPPKNTIEKEKDDSLLKDNSINNQTRLNKNPIRQCSDPNKCLLPMNNNLYAKAKKGPKKCKLVQKIIKKGNVYGPY